MAIHQTTREEFGQEVTLYRWECLFHPTKKGVWLRDREKACEGMRKHLANLPHIKIEGSASSKRDRG